MTLRMSTLWVLPFQSQSHHQVCLHTLSRLNIENHRAASVLRDLSNVVPDVKKKKETSNRMLSFLLIVNAGKSNVKGKGKENPSNKKCRNDAKGKKKDGWPRMEVKASRIMAPRMLTGQVL